jgi:hypothetical protein
VEDWRLGLIIHLFGKKWLYQKLDRCWLAKDSNSIGPVVGKFPRALLNFHAGVSGRDESMDQ